MLVYQTNSSLGVNIIFKSKSSQTSTGNNPLFNKKFIQNF